MGVVLAVVGDLHTNSIVGLAAPVVTLEEGGTYRANKVQKWLWRKWQDYVARVARAREGHRLIVVLNGDVTDGDHHDTSQIITRNPATQLELARKALEPLTDLLGEGDHLIVIKGTPSHVGQSGWMEEELAHDLGAEPEGTSYARNYWWANIEGVWIHIGHHGKMSGLPWTRGNSVNRLAVEMSQTHIERDMPVPHLVIRGHRHKVADSGINNRRTRAIQAPCWQFPTAYAHMVALGQPSDIGALIVTCEAGRYTVEHVSYEPEKDKPWTLPRVS